MEPNKTQQIENTEVINISKVLYTGNVLVTGGRNGEAATRGNINVQVNILV